MVTHRQVFWTCPNVLSLSFVPFFIEGLKVRERERERERDRDRKRERGGEGGGYGGSGGGIGEEKGG